LGGLTVLLLEDSEDLRILFARFLETAGAIVRAAVSASHARAVFKQITPDVIISDIGLPDEDGITFLRSIRELNTDVPAIAVTAFSNFERIALESGFDAFIPKPVCGVDLIATVAFLTEKSDCIH
jgi:DNA-binding response OmpR family regulator